MSMGDGSLKRNEIQYKLCGSYMRVQNAATGAVTEFTTGLTVQEVEIAADVIWTNCFLERHKKSVVLSAQRNYDRLFKNAGFNWKTFKAVDSVNPVLWVIDYLSDCEEKIVICCRRSFLTMNIWVIMLYMVDWKMCCMLNTIGCPFHVEWLIVLLQTYQECTGIEDMDVIEV